MMKLINVSVIAICLFTISIMTMCKETETCKWDAEPPLPVLFQLKKNGQIVTDSILLSSIKLYYYKSNSKVYMPRFGLFIGMDPNTYYKKGLMYADIGLFTDIKTYYLEYPSGFGSQDTLYADFLAPTPQTNCVYLLNKLALNSKTLSKSVTDFSIATYIFEKK